jgi:retron-type reverse transcriptase
MLMSAAYEQDFRLFSYGFSSGHSFHQTIEELHEKWVALNINWIVDADVSKFFDNLDHELLLEIIRKRINDGWDAVSKWMHLRKSLSEYYRNTCCQHHELSIATEACLQGSNGYSPNGLVTVWFLSNQNRGSV